tara:strand:- start:384 stop:593 length:210 start_codon:yes stop_codon:yes gene_type:complete
MKIISKCALLKLIGCLVASPIIVYAILLIARAAGANYDMTHGETFIIWILMAILIAQCWRCSDCNDKKK